ncbi:integrase_H2C2 domain-containing protein [Trichonephila clavipes]|nr:integrase_H2C2 domain-containing protein [Trichonephila clavipes]
MGFYRTYIPNYAEISTPLTELTTKNKFNDVSWGKAEQNSFVKLKNLLCEVTSLATPDANLSFQILRSLALLQGGIPVATELQQLHPITCDHGYVTLRSGKIVNNLCVAHPIQKLVTLSPVQLSLGSNPGEAWMFTNVLCLYGMGVL